MNDKLTKLYDNAFYAKHEDWRNDYVAIADALMRVLEFRSVLDLGCGNGYILQALKRHGKQIVGVDGSRAAVASAPAEIQEHFLILDLCEPINLGCFDLVICTEVAEHLNEIYAEQLIRSICERQPMMILFTAAIPGQTGKHHVNLQAPDYWVSKFEQWHYQLDKATSSLMQEELASQIARIKWIVRNLMIFRPTKRG